MKLVVEIDKSIYDCVLGKTVLISHVNTICKAIADGTPLPKGHGRIADIDKVLEEMKATRTYDIPFALERVKPIIEADGGEDDEND